MYASMWINFPTKKSYFLFIAYSNSLWDNCETKGGKIDGYFIGK